MIASPADLNYFSEVATTLNLSRAAERLGISQPSLTLAIQRLETSLGTRLLNRSPRGVTLTQAGKQLLNHTRSLLQAWEDVRVRALSSQSEIQGRYSLGIHVSVGLISLPHFLPGLLARHRKLEIKLVHDLSRKITEGVISSQIDIGIVVNPVKHPDLVMHKVCTDDVTFWTSEKGKSTLEDPFSGQGHLICDPSMLQSRDMMKRIKKHGMTFARSLETNSHELAADLVGKGAGVGILPARVAANSRYKLKRLPQVTAFQDEHFLIYRVENKNVRSIQAIAAEVRGFFNSDAN